MTHSMMRSNDESEMADSELRICAIVTALMALLACVLLLLSASSYAASQSIGAANPALGATPIRKTSPYHPVSVPERARTYYQAVWGIDNLLVRQTASGNLIRFSYRVTNPAQAQALNSPQATPYLFGQRSHAMLQVPVMDKVGQLRQTGKQEAGQGYWMVFSNQGNLVKSGDRVDVTIGSFHAVGLMVE